MSDTPKWTSAIPNTDGYYWWKQETYVDDCPELLQEVLEISDGKVMGSGRPAGDFDYGEWLGPITPADFEELASLREQVDRFRGGLEAVKKHGHADECGVSWSKGKFTCDCHVAIAEAALKG